MQDSRPSKPFDDIAPAYDRVVAQPDGFPFEGYELILDAVLSESAVGKGMSVLDLGIGTGNLALRFVNAGCQVWGIDFSAKMLTEARDKIPGLTLIKSDLLDQWTGVDRRFDRVVSSYALHHFDLSSKVSLLRRAAREHLLPGGKIVIADVAFTTAAEHAEHSSP